MSVLMTLRVKGDPTKLEAEDQAVLMSIVDRGKNFGIISHHFYGTDDEVLVIDEWPDEQSFQAFFDASPEIAGVMSRAGVTTEPEIKFWRRLTTGDDLG